MIGAELYLYLAFHTSSLPDGRYAGVATGVILDVEGVRIYHAGDTRTYKRDENNQRIIQTEYCNASYWRLLHYGC